MSAPSQPPYQQFFCQSCLSKFPIPIMMCTFAIITESPTTCFFFSCFFFGSTRKKSLMIFLVVMMCKGMQKKVIFCCCDSQRNKELTIFFKIVIMQERAKKTWNLLFFCWYNMWKNLQKLADFSCFFAMVCKKVKTKNSFSFFCCCNMWMKSITKLSTLQIMHQLTW